jgi:hypothetical protein
MTDTQSPRAVAVEAASSRLGVRVREGLESTRGDEHQPADGTAS